MKATWRCAKRGTSDGERRSAMFRKLVLVTVLLMVLPVASAFAARPTHVVHRPNHVAVVHPHHVAPVRSNYITHYRPYYGPYSGYYYRPYSGSYYWPYYYPTYDVTSYPTYYGPYYYPVYVPYPVPPTSGTTEPASVPTPP